MIRKKKKYQTGFTASAFDLLHAGHIAMLQDAKSVCNHLIVGLHIDPSIENPDKSKPIQSLIERQIQINAVKYVDEVICYSTEDELLGILQTMPIDVRIIGEEYQNKFFTGDSVDHHIYFNKRRHFYSSSDLRFELLQRAIAEAMKEEEEERNRKGMEKPEST